MRALSSDCGCDHGESRKYGNGQYRTADRSGRLTTLSMPDDDVAVRVLVVEDDRTIAEFVAAGLRQEGYAVDAADNGVDGLELARSGAYDAAVVDVMLPRLDGLSLVGALRRAGVHTPVLFLSAKHAVDDRVRGLQSGGDDYLTKPFAFAELVARLQAITRRGAAATEANELSVADLRLDRLSRRVERAGTPIDLRPREYALLEYLMRNPGKVVSKTMIVSHVWDYSFDTGTNAVDVLVYRLREKIDRAFEPKLLHTVRGVGYVLKVE
jgi:two-component system OmpR family response regulator